MANTMTALGLMSGTSMDGIDAALIETDGQNAGKRIASDFLAYPDDIKTAIRACLGLSADTDGRVAAAETLVTDWHIKMVRNFAAAHDHKIDLVGFHGQTIFHDPANGRTWQIGDGGRLARETGIDVMFDFRTADVQNGGQGAPLLPLYHQALIRQANLAEPACILNIGGVGNIAWTQGDDIYACDTGPGNALIDDWMLRQTGTAMDRNGEAASLGKIDEARIERWMQNPFFAAPAPKSLDRNAFADCTVDDMSTEDGAATLAAFTVASVIRALALMPAPASKVIVAGGGRKNPAIMHGLGSHVAVANADQMGWPGDYMEAEGFAYLAVRALRGLHTSLPTTTGCETPTIGGRLATAK